MFSSAVRHLSFYPFVQPLARNRVRFVLEAAPGDLKTCELVWWKRTNAAEQHNAPLHIRIENGRVTQWQTEVVFSEEVHYIKYGFFLTDRTGNRFWLNAYGLQAEPAAEGSFEILQINQTDVNAIPDWSRGCIYYQIFPERFARNGTARGEFAPWDALPTRDNYLGGNLAGIISHLAYLSDLGIECIYLNPIFLGDFNHKYATTDYLKIDPMFGTEPELTELVEKAHSLGIRVILDGVFNHTGIHFAPFMDLMEKGQNSAYKDWFYPKQYPIRVDASCYECVGDYPYMPRLNGENPEVRAYVRDVLIYWIEHTHIDGWRFDVADELDRHAVTWWREEIKRRFPEAVLLCETWGDASRLLGADGFDCAMNYLFRDAMIDYFAHGTITETDLAKRLNSMLMRYPDETNLSMYNCLGSHDTARFLTEAGGEIWRLRLAMAFQMLFPGAPALYYGDELGMTGENDPGCRGGMVWDKPDQNLLSWEKELIRMRKQHPAVRRGKYTVLMAEDHIFAFLRESEKDRVAAVFNTGDQMKHLDFAELAGSVDVLPHSVKIINPS